MVRDVRYKVQNRVQGLIIGAVYFIKKYYGDVCEDCRADDSIFFTNIVCISLLVQHKKIQLLDPAIFGLNMNFDNIMNIILKTFNFRDSFAL